MPASHAQKYDTLLKHEYCVSVAGIDKNGCFALHVEVMKSYKVLFRRSEGSRETE